MSEDVRRIEPPRAVEVLHDGVWVAGWIDGWVRWPSTGEWWASVRYGVQYEWGIGQHVRSLPATSVRLMTPPA